ncbi:MAG: hypothetical protein ACR2NM_16280 [Bythopirellula sp.]
MPTVLWVFVVLSLVDLPVAEAANNKYWELSPYRVHLHLAIDDSAQPQPELGDQLVADLRRKIRTTIYPLWSTEISLATGRVKQELLARLDRLEVSTVESLSIDNLVASCDKRIFLTAKTTPLGITLHSREFDCTMRRWGAMQQRYTRQSWSLSAQCFDLVCQTFSPLAVVRALRDEEKVDKEVLLRFRGSDLPQQSDLSFFNVAGEAYQPLTVRTNSAGEFKIDTIRDISWTYLTLAEQQQDGWHAVVHTGTRRPFGIRRRGRMEYLAIAMRRPVGNTRVRFYARHDPQQGLIGYEVFRREPGESETQPIGLTDPSGAVEVAPGASKVALLFLRSEGQLLAKVPVVAGAKPLLEVPIADDTARLRAQAALTSLTERLIDTVAQRNILIARVRDRIANGKLDQAQDLFTTLDNLPGRSKFVQDIDSAENRSLHQSDDPKVQARIEKLFADTRKLLGKFLNTRQITELQSELTAARRTNAS